MSKKMCGFVIGPIYETIMQSRSLAQHWFASYIFSEISRNTIIKIYEEFDNDEFNLEFLVPRINKGSLNNNSSFGKFPDQIIFTVDGEVLDISEKLNEIVEYVKFDEYDDYTLEKMKSSYFDIDYIVQDGTSLSELLSHLNAIDNSVTNYEITDKLFINSFTKESKGEFERFAENYAGFGSSLDSIEDMIATSGFKENYAVVYYDGNSVGQTLGDLYEENQEKYKQASEGLFNFSDNVSEYLLGLMREYNCLPLYIAGDDGFMIMPINNNDMYFMDVLDEIDKKYQQYVGGIHSDLTLRFSIVIAEHKIPFKILYNKVYDGLYEAKNLKDSTNNIQLKIVRGGTEDTNFIYNFADFKNDNVGESAALLKAIISGEKFEEGNYLPASLISRLHTLEYVLSDVWNTNHMKTCLENVFEISDNKQRKIVNEIISEVDSKYEDNTIEEKVEFFINLLTDYIKIFNYLDVKQGGANNA